MNNNFTITVRVFAVTIRDERTGSVSEDTITLTRQQLQAAQIVGQSSKELIYRLYNREGYQVLDIRKPVKMTVPVDVYANVTGGEVVIEGTAGLEG